MKADLNRLEAIILSHGHPDHFFGLEGLLKFITEEGQKEIPLFLHPDAFLERRINIPAVGHPTLMPALDESTLKAAGVIPIKSQNLFRLQVDLFTQQER